MDLQPIVHVAVVLADDPRLFDFGNLGRGGTSSPFDVHMIESIFLILWVIVILRVVW